MAYSRKLVALGRLTAGIAHEVKNPLNAMMIHLELLRTKIRNGALAVEPRPRAGGGVGRGHRPGRGGARARSVARGAGRARARRDHRERNPPARRGGPGVPEVHAARGAAARSGQHERLVRRDHAGGRAGGAGEQRQGGGGRAGVAAAGQRRRRRCCARRFSTWRSTAARRCPTAGRSGSSARRPPATASRCGSRTRASASRPSTWKRSLTCTSRRRIMEPGIGLSMVYRIIQMHDGEVEVQSTPGSGTTFRILAATSTAMNNPRLSRTLDSDRRMGRTALGIWALGFGLCCAERERLREGRGCERARRPAACRCRRRRSGCSRRWKSRPSPPRPGARDTAGRRRAGASRARRPPKRGQRRPRPPRPPPRQRRRRRRRRPPRAICRPLRRPTPRPSAACAICSRAPRATSTRWITAG